MEKTQTRIFASPLAKRIAQDNGVDLAAVLGTGPHGRIVRADVEASMLKPSRPIALQVQPAADGAAYEAIPNNMMRKTIARRLTEAKQTIPHFYLTVDCQLDALLALRSKLNKSGKVKISVNDFIIRATALALQEVPEANSAWTNEATLRYAHSDISVAVSTDGGLITPIVAQAEGKTLGQISSEIKDLALRARAGKLKPEEFQGGTFTISNLGMFGVREFAAIVNPPQACILAIGVGEPRAVVKDGALAIATVMSCTLSTDHRAVDGAVGAQFLAAFKALIEDPYSLIV